MTTPTRPSASVKRVSIEGGTWGAVSVILNYFLATPPDISGAVTILVTAVGPALMTYLRNRAVGGSVTGALLVVPAAIFLLGCATTVEKTGDYLRRGKEEYGTYPPEFRAAVRALVNRPGDQCVATVVCEGDEEPE